MEQFRLNGLITDSLQLFRRHGLGIYLDFLAAGVLLTTYVALANPETLRARMSGVRPDGSAGLIELVLLQPGSYVSSAIFSLVMAGAFLRLWRAEFGFQDTALVNPEQSLRQSLVMLVLLQMVADMVFTLTLLTILPVAAVIAALTMGLLPAILLEARSWDAVGRSFQIAWPRIWLYALVWFFIVVAWVASIILFDPADPQLAGASALRIWLAAVGSDIAAPVFSAFGLCFTAAVYRQTLDREAGGSGDVSDIFR